MSVDLDGSGSTDPDNNIDTLQWDNTEGADVGTVVFPNTLALPIEGSGLSMTTDSGDVTVTVTDSTGLSDTDTASLSYLNVGPNVISAMGIENIDLSMTFNAAFEDPDLFINGLIPDFEALMIEVSQFANFGNGFLSGIGISLSNTLDRALLESIFNGPGTFQLFANVTDKAGATDSLAFENYPV